VAFNPLRVLLGQDRADEPDQRALIGEGDERVPASREENCLSEASIASWGALAVRSRRESGLDSGSEAPAHDHRSTSLEVRQAGLRLRLVEASQKTFEGGRALSRPRAES